MLVPRGKLTQPGTAELLSRAKQRFGELSSRKDLKPDERNEMNHLKWVLERKGSRQASLQNWWNMRGRRIYLRD
jgi:hypothetical protein